ncbi:BTAD domain-containing putative transcriptional regulator [Rudaeicoccus suwonensis]|uniref:Putative ATPase n=1 Tax=Rudaeicoccus suwonensis TaxID=657409 RepID=A0A561E441_9MICO|nr:BTAD domain-containing putative transcriptional regulator [Rudaeicoccus suwonensis]TWE10383.1 putative ATPase [Rudaeicoccus suwonensis]
MAAALTVLESVCWHGTPLPGDRSHALIAALVLAEGRTVSPEDLIADVWREASPADARKALQVLVSRVRKQSSAQVVEHTAGGYSLGLARTDVDALATLDACTAMKTAARQGDWATVHRLAADLPAATRPSEVDDALAEIRDRVAAAVTDCRALHGRALSRLGHHQQAVELLAPFAEAALPEDDVLVDYLRSLAAAGRLADAAERYERHRHTVAERTGGDPSPALQRLHRELLASDDPVQQGVRTDGTSFIGRDDDLQALTAAVATRQVTTILGPGGLGKTRIAHLVAARARQPVVHFIELVGVTQADDLEPTVLAAIGARDKVSDRHQVTDPRARIVTQLAVAPTLLVLDNCEQIIEAVAALVGPLVAQLPDLAVLTTSRMPLAIHAEHLYPLAQLSGEQAVQLFTDRATAARPGITLDSDTVAQVCDRLDGLPLAIELAAARTRVMSVADIRDRLDQRFALLRGNIRDAPQRHQTLHAVIDWSWQMLDLSAQRALRELSVFPDGFDLSDAEVLLRHTSPDADGLTAVETLLDHSLLQTYESDGAGRVRYRMLETVREFGRDRLAEAGDTDVLRAALRRWAQALCRDLADRVHGSTQVDVVDKLWDEEVNLTAVLDDSVDSGDIEAAVDICRMLLWLWQVTSRIPMGFARREAMTRIAVDPVVTDPHSLDSQRVLLDWIQIISSFLSRTTDPAVTNRLRELGPGDDPAISGSLRASAAMALTETAGQQAAEGALTDLAADESPWVRRAATRWLAHLFENAGRTTEALSLLDRALAELDPDLDGPWATAELYGERSGLLVQSGRREEAARDAATAISPMRRLHADYDAAMALLTIALGRLDAGDVSGSEQVLQQIDNELLLASQEAPNNRVVDQALAEIAAAKGDLPKALELQRLALRRVRGIHLEGFATEDHRNPWLLGILAANLTTYAWHSPDDPDAADLAQECADLLRLAVADLPAQLDLPALGAITFAFGLWLLARDDSDALTGATLLVLAHRAGYNQAYPSMDWTRGSDFAQQRAPGAMDRARAQLEREWDDGSWIESWQSALDQRLQILRR